MALDDQVRKNADALAKELGLDIQQALGRFLDDVLGQAARHQDSLQAQAEQAIADAEGRAEVARAAVAEVQTQAEAQKAQVLATAKDESAAAVQAAITQTREHVAREAAGLVARAREEAAQAHAALNADREARKAVDEEAAALRSAAEQGSLAAMERLLDAFRRLDQSTTLTGLIDTLAETAAGETTRSAVFVVRGRDVRGWRLAGFSDAPADVRAISVSLDGAGAIGVCVRSKSRVEITPATFAGGDLAFLSAADAAAGLAMPVTLGGETAAVIYGDDGGAGGPAGWRETIEILARHASRCLEAQTAIRAAKLAPGAKPEPVGAER